jgi:hypothetical protein
MVGKRKKILENENYWNKTSIYEYNTILCTVSYWILREHCDREWVNNRGVGVNLIKAWYIDLKYQGEIPLDYQYSPNEKKWRAGGKNKSFLGVGTSGKGVCTRK